VAATVRLFRADGRGRTLAMRAEELQSLIWRRTGLPVHRTTGTLWVPSVDVELSVREGIVYVAASKVGIEDAVLFVKIRKNNRDEVLARRLLRVPNDR
jgi:hypothetical protein